MATITYVPSRLGEGFFIDVPVPGSGDDDKALTYDHGTGEFVYVAFDAAGTAAATVAAHAAAGDPHTQYELESNNTAAAILTKVLTVDGAGSGLDADLLDGQSSAAFLRASGADTGAVSSRQVFTNGITAPNWQPASDSTTALQMRTASGTALLTGNTTNSTIVVEGQLYAARGTNSSNFFAGNAGNATTTGNNNISIGNQAGQALTTGGSNNNFGFQSGYLLTIGAYNNNLGYLAGFSMTAAEYNNNFGYRAGYSLTTGSYNNNFGTDTGFSLTTGTNNNNFGNQAGYSNATGSRNVMIGYQAGYNETGSDKLYIANSNTANPLIYGDFAAGRLGIGNGSPNNTLDVAGTIQADSLRLDVTPTSETITPTHTITFSANGTNYKIPCAAA